VAIQIAGGQLTPRIIATTLLRDRAIRYTVGLHVFTLLFAISGLNRQGSQVGQLVTLSVGLLGLVCLATFLFLIDYSARLLRPVRILALVCDDGMKVIRAVYPDSVEMGSATASTTAQLSLGLPGRTVLHTGQSQIVLALDTSRLVAEAGRADGVVEFVPQIGDFVATGEPLYRLYGGAAAVDDEVLRQATLFGAERTMEQDPTFAFRIMVDIAIKALSPAINDPTTAVLAIDQIHRLLRFVGLRQLHGDVITDTRGQMRVILRTPNWEDFVHIACSEIRTCGASSVQIVRRQRAMLDNLMASLPTSRRVALCQELDTLDKILPNYYRLPEELALARVADTQGLGGAAKTVLR
jgi:uncharacterized membrane protein